MNRTGIAAEEEDQQAQNVLTIVKAMFQIVEEVPLGGGIRKETQKVIEIGLNLKMRTSNGTSCSHGLPRSVELAQS